MDLFPDTAGVQDGHLSVAGVRAATLAEEHGTPLLVLCADTIRARARAYRKAAPDALVVYGTKAFPNVSVLKVLAEEGLGADVSTLGELRFAQRAGITGDALVVHGNNKDDEELAEAAAAGALVVLDALDEFERAAAAGVERTLVRLTLGVEAETHEAIRTGQHGSKFGLPPEQAIEAIEHARPLGLHVHIGSQLVDGAAARLTVDRLAEFAAECRDRLGWTPELVDLGGGLGVRTTPDDPEPPSIADFVRELLGRVGGAWAAHDLGLIAFGLAVRSRGWRITYLGPSTPVTTLAEAARLIEPTLIVLSASLGQRLEGADAGLRELASAFRLALGGPGATVELASRVGAELLPQDPLDAAVVV